MSLLCSRGSVFRFALLAPLTLFASCNPEPKLPKGGLDETANSMDAIAAGLEEFGTASISAPVLAAPDDGFKFSPTKIDADQFYSDAKTNVQSRAAEFQQQATIVGLAARASYDPTMVAAYAAQLAQYHQAVAQNTQAQGLLDLKNRLINSAAVSQYTSALQAAQAETDPTKRAADVSAAIQSLNNSMIAPVPTTAPAYPSATQPAAAPMDLAKNASDAAALFSDNKFAGFQGLLSGQSNPVLSDRDALFIAAGDNATLAIFKTLGDPSILTKFKDKKVLLGAMTVAVNPGWRTRRNYSVNIAVQVSFEPAPARLEVVKNFIGDARFDLGIRKRIAMSYALPLPAGSAAPFPLDGVIPPEYSTKLMAHAAPDVAAVSPMTQTQVQSDESSRRQQWQYALDLAGAFGAAGLTAQANFFDHYAKSLQKDVSTIGALNVVNAYSYSGGLFGFEIGPNLRAIENPSSHKYSGPESVLGRQSFPALVLFGFEDDELRPRIERDSNGEFRLIEQKIKLDSSTRWMPLDSNPYNRKRFSERSRIAWMRNLQKAGNKLFSEEKAQERQRLAADASYYVHLVEKRDRGFTDFNSMQALNNDLDALSDDPGLKKLAADQNYIEAKAALKSALSLLRQKVSFTTTRDLYEEDCQQSKKKLETLQLQARQERLRALMNSIVSWLGRKTPSPSLPSVSTAAITSLSQHVTEEDEAIGVLRHDLNELEHPTQTAIDDVRDHLGDLRNWLKQAAAIPAPVKSTKGHTPGGPEDTADQTVLNAILPTIKTRVHDLQYRVFDASNDLNLPVQYICPAPDVKHPNVALVASDFVPLPNATVPTKPIEITLYGKDLTVVDLKGIALVSGDGQLLASGTDAPSIANGVIHLKLQVKDIDQPFAFVLKRTDGGDSIYSLPYMIPRVDWWNPSHPAIRRITGPAADPSQQRIDQTEYTPGVSDSVVHSLNDRDKPPVGKSSSVDIKISHKSKGSKDEDQ